MASNNFDLTDCQTELSGPTTPPTMILSPTSFRMSPMTGSSTVTSVTESPNELPAVQLSRLVNVVIDRSAHVSPLQLSKVAALYRDKIMPLLEALYPRSACEKTFSEGRQESFSAANVRLLIYGATNNWAGIEDLASEWLYSYIKPISTQLYRMESNAVCKVNLFRDIPSSRPLAETIFRCAVDNGDVDAVNALLNYGIDVNKQVCFASVKWAKNIRVTPLERAADLKHYSLVSLLIQWRGDVCKTYTGQHHPRYRNIVPPRGALEWALAPNEEFGNLSTWHYEKLYDFENLPLVLEPSSSPSNLKTLLDNVLEAGGILYPCENKITCPQLIKVLKATKHFDAFQLIVKLTVGDNHEKFNKLGLFHEAFLTLDRPKLEVLAKHMCTIGADFSFVYRCDIWSLDRIESLLPWTIEKFFLTYAFDQCNTTRWFRNKALLSSKSPSIACMEISAGRGEAALVWLLHRYGAKMTPNVLPAAIRSRNEELINSLISTMPNGLHSFSPLYSATPYSEAIRSRNYELQRKCEFRGFPEEIRDPYQLSAIIAAAAGVGNEALVRDLLGLENHVSYGLLTPALVEAAAGNYTSISLLLLQEGVDLEIAPTHLGEELNWHPLEHALRNRNTTLVNALLDHGITTGAKGRSLEEAVRWGKQDVISRILAAGCSIYDGLATAIELNHCWCIDQILSCVGTNNDVVFLASLETALAKAVRLNNHLLILQLLEAGVDPASTSALTSAIALDNIAAKFLLQRFRACYPDGKLGFGEGVLSWAIHLGNEDYLKAVIQLRIGLRYRWQPYSPRETDTPLAKVISRQNGKEIRMTELLLETVLDPNMIVRHRDDSGSETPLLVAINTRNPEMVTLILKHAEVNFPARGMTRRTPLQRASELGDVKLVKLLLKRGALVNALPAIRHGVTALQAAANGGFIGIAELLLENNAELTAPGAQVHGMTALQGAASHGRFDMVVFLLKQGAHPKQDVQKAMRLARETGSIAIADTLENHARIMAVEHDPLQGMIDLQASLVEDYDDTDTAMEPYASLSENARPERLIEVAEPMVDVLRSEIRENPNQVEDNMDVEDTSQAVAPLFEPGFSIRSRRCSNCAMRFCNGSALKRHQRSACKLAQKLNPTFRCERCNKGFQRRDTFVRHVAKHDKGTRVKCVYCGREFSRPDYLKQHMTTCAANDMDAADHDDDDYDETGENEHDEENDDETGDGNDDQNENDSYAVPV